MMFRNPWGRYGAALGLLAVCTISGAEALWTVTQPVVLPLSGDIYANTDGRGFVVQSHAGGHFAVTEDAVLAIDTSIHELLASDGEWLTLRGILTGVQVRKSRGGGLIPFEACPGLLPGADSQIGNLHCANGALRRMSGLEVTANYPMPTGYLLRDIWSESQVLLEREVDQAMYVGTVQAAAPSIVPMALPGLTAADLVERLQRVRFLNGLYVVFRSNRGYRVLGNTSHYENIATSGAMLSRQQCLFGTFLANRLAAVEMIDAGLRLRTYSMFEPLVLLREDPLEPGDRLVCALTAAGGSLTGPHIVRPHADGDRLLRANTSGLTLIYTAVDPIRGVGRLLIVGQKIFVRYADGSVHRMESTGVPSQQTALMAPSEFARPIEAGTLATDPVREYLLSRAADTDMAQVEITARDPVTGQPISTTQIPLGMTLTESGFTSVSQVQRHASWPAQRRLIAVHRKASASAPAALVYFSIGDLQPATPLLDQSGTQADLDALVLSGARVHALEFATAPARKLLRFGFDGSYQGEAQVQGTRLVGQSDGSVLVLRATASDIVVTRLLEDQATWERGFASNCRLLDFDAFPLVSCVQGSLPLTTLSRLDAQTGATVWQRLVTPLDLQLSFDARIAWTQDSELRVLSWGTLGGSRAISVARINSATGTLLGISNTLGVSATGFSFLGVHGFPFTHRWIYLLLTNGSQRQRVAIRVDSNGSISANLTGQSLVTDAVYLSESVDRMATNEGVRWFVSGAIQGHASTSAQAFPQTSLSLPLGLGYDVVPRPGREDLAVVRIKIINPNPSDALAARLHLSLFECPEIDDYSGTINVNVPASGERVVGCTVHFNADAPLETTAYLRQPLNGVLIRDFVTLPLSVSALLRSGFEDD